MQNHITQTHRCIDFGHSTPSKMTFVMKNDVRFITLFRGTLTWCSGPTGFARYIPNGSAKHALGVVFDPQTSCFLIFSSNGAVDLQNLKLFRKLMSAIWSSQALMGRRRTSINQSNKSSRLRARRVCRS